MTRLRPTRRVVLAGLVGAAALLCGIALTATSGWLVVRASERPQILLLLTSIVAVRAFGMFRPVFRYGERLLSHDAALDDLAERRADLYTALVPLSPGRLGARARTEVLTGVVDDLTDVAEAPVRVTVPVIASAVAGLGAAALVAVVSPAVGLVLAALVLALALACARAWRVESRSTAELLAARAEVFRVSELVARQGGELAAIGGTDTALGWLDRAHDTLRRAAVRQARGRGLVAAVAMWATGAATVASAHLAVGVGLSAPMTVLLVVTPVAVGDALAGVVDAMRALARAQAAARRLGSLLAQQPAVADPAISSKGHEPPPDARRVVTSRSGGEGVGVRLRGVAAEWVPGRPALPPISLDLPPGSRTAVVGSNGSGKSTLLAVLARHLDPVEGTYTLDGADVRSQGLEEVRARIAVVDDEPHVFATTLRENLRLAADPDAECRDPGLVDALRRAGLGAWWAGLEDGLDTRLGTGGLGVSGGERARLGLARAVVSGRPVVLLDEPVAHLDHATAVAVLDDLADAMAGRTLVMVTHRPEGLVDFDTIVDLDARHEGG